MAKRNRTTRAKRTTPRKRATGGRRSPGRTTEVCIHPDQTVPMRPEVGTLLVVTGLG